MAKIESVLERVYIEWGSAPYRNKASFQCYDTKPNLPSFCKKT